jgi:Heterokaryon incompatibility protein (HET)
MFTRSRTVHYAKEIRQNRPIPQQVITDKQYHHSPLPSSRHIRLLTLGPGARSQPVTVSLAHHDIDHCPPFEALSYTWGDPKSKVPIYCEDQAFKVGTNLHGALLRLRYDIIPRLLWVDGICIDQSSPTERSSQVLLMREIYSRASAVVVWLGNQATDSERGFELIHQISAFARQATTDKAAPRPITPQELERLKLPPVGSLDWKAVDAIYYRAWFFRVWILQEIALARSATILCGDQRLPWSEMVDAAGYIKSRAIDALVDCDPSGIQHLSELVSVTQRQTGITLLQALLLSRTSEATDPRDRVYALLGLTSDNASKAIEPDYTQSVADVFTMTTIQIIQHEKSLSVLSHVENFAWRPKAPELPSWIPDWASPAKSTPFLSSSYEMQPVEFRATLDSSPDISFVSTDRVCNVKGYIVDTIRNIGRRFYLLEPRNKLGEMGKRRHAFKWASVEVMVQSLLQWERLAYRQPSYPTHETVQSAYHKTIIANQHVADSALPSLSSLYASFSSFYHNSFTKRSVAAWLSSTQLVLELVKDADQPAIAAYYQKMLRASVGRRFCVTEKGFFALVPASVTPGDRVVLLKGGKTPYVVRPKSDDLWRFLGDCYVHGLMRGEAWDPTRDLQEFMFV